MIIIRDRKEKQQCLILDESRATLGTALRGPGDGRPRWDYLVVLPVR
jgi:hypothetical protein